MLFDILKNATAETAFSAGRHTQLSTVDCALLVEKSSHSRKPGVSDVSAEFLVRHRMGFTLFNVFKAGLLVANAVAILHPKRFLSKCEFR